MSMVDAKVINTRYGLEMYCDKDSSVVINEVHSPTDKNPYYEVLIGVEFLVMKNQKDMYPMKNFFWISMSEDFQTVKIKETEMGNLFALKDSEERKATKEMVAQWLFKTESFKKAITTWIKKESHSVQPDEEQFLNNLLYLSTENLESAFIEAVN
ncbi:hypothetical protein D8M04_05020 [Oceanobacillus piezotolerans]|uniref:Uncharacterized protein n=1 Tax=Oceanobacillus piezotolerans TaxID=2448030 RepID=A0A498DF73_9BACI|nr:hypothetical protein [Oceanobacillus piezotolerans]RLL46571.1 hypothetical protein D8M04_05020 [Oceanobacillus piezotolerans]